MDAIIHRGRHVRVDPWAVQTYLPTAYRMSTDSLGYLDVQSFIHQSELVRKGFISWDTAEHVWTNLLDELRANRDLSRVTIGIREQLSEEFQRDKLGGTSALSRESIFPNALETFLCLAEISSICRSTQIGTILASFWNKHGQDIVRLDHFALHLWGLSIINAHMSRTERVLCLRNFQRAHSEALLDVARLKSPNAYHFIKRLEQIDFHQNDRLGQLGEHFPFNGGFFRDLEIDRPSSLPRRRPPVIRSQSTPPHIIGYDSIYPLLRNKYIFPPRSHFSSPKLISDVPTGFDKPSQAVQIENLHDRMDNLEAKFGSTLGIPSYRAMAFSSSRQISPIHRACGLLAGAYI